MPIRKSGLRFAHIPLVWTIIAGFLIGMALTPVIFFVRSEQKKAQAFEEKFGVPYAIGRVLDGTRSDALAGRLRPESLATVERFLMQGTEKEQWLALSTLTIIAAKEPNQAAPVIAKGLERLDSEGIALALASTAGLLPEQYQASVNTTIALRRDDLGAKLKVKVNETFNEAQERRKHRQSGN